MLSREQLNQKNPFEEEITKKSLVKAWAYYQSIHPSLKEQWNSSKEQWNSAKKQWNSSKEQWNPLKEKRNSFFKDLINICFFYSSILEKCISEKNFYYAYKVYVQINISFSEMSFKTILLQSTVLKYLIFSGNVKKDYVDFEFEKLMQRLEKLVNPNKEKKVEEISLINRASLFSLTQVCHLILEIFSKKQFDRKYYHHFDEEHLNKKCLDKEYFLNEHFDSSKVNRCLEFMLEYSLIDWIMVTKIFVPKELFNEDEIKEKQLQSGQGYEIFVNIFIKAGYKNLARTCYLEAKKNGLDNYRIWIDMLLIADDIKEANIFFKKIERYADAFSDTQALNQGHDALSDYKKRNSSSVIPYSFIANLNKPKSFLEQNNLREEFKKVFDRRHGLGG